MRALVDFKPQLSRNQRLRQFDEQIVQIVLELPSHLEGIPESPGRDEPGNRATPLDEGIRKQGRCMYDLSDRLRLQARFRQEVTDPRHGAQRRIARGRQLLVRERMAILWPVYDDVREGAANVDAERTIHHAAPHLTDSHPPDRG